MAVTKITVLPDEHVQFAWKVTSPEFREAVRVLAKRVSVPPVDFYKAILQSMYNVHVRALEHVPRGKNPLSMAALPLVGAHGEVFLGATSRDLDVLPDEPDKVRAHLSLVETERKLKKKDRILHSAIFHASFGRKSHTFISVHEQHVAEAITQLLQGQHPDRLASIIAWETFLGYGASEKQQRHFRLKASRTLGEQVAIEKKTGADEFRKAFPAVSKKFMREDFAPLLRIVERRA